MQINVLKYFCCALECKHKCALPMIMYEISEIMKHFENFNCTYFMF